MTGAQPKQGNVKLTVSVKKETRETLKQNVKGKFGLGLLIDCLVEKEFPKKEGRT